MSFPRYPEYKDSGVEWLGAVPRAWSIEPIKRRYEVVGGSTPKTDEPAHWDGAVPWITPADLSRLQGFDISVSLRSITEGGLESCGTKLVPAGSIVLSTRAPIGSLGVATMPLSTNQGCKSLVPRASESPRYLAYLLSVATEELNIRGRGTTFLELSADELGAFRVPFPAPGEQRAIAAFLDRETAKIDALVAEQQKLIALLKEKRQAVISHAVTKGLNPNVPMKDSGVEWLGEVPAHWPVVRGRFLFRHADDPPCDDDGVVTAFRDGQVTLRENRRTEGFTQAILEVGYQHVRTGDLVIHGMDAFAGAIGVSESDGKCTPEYSVLRPFRDDVCSEYFAVILRLMARRNFIYVICPSVRERAPRFRYEAFKDVWLPDPPAEEQRAVMEYVASQLQKIDGLTNEAGLAIDLLRERRSTLISAAVTGQIDVRGLAVPQSCDFEAVGAGS